MIDLEQDVMFKSAAAVALSCLNERYKRVLCMRFGLDGQPELSVAELAGELGISASRAREIQNRALRQARRSLSERIARRRVPS